MCEELGLIGAGIVLILFALLVMRGYWIAIHARDRFGALLVVGITTLTAVQVFLNISVVTNLIPTTGISLPFFSYGGTALMIQLAEMGIILSVSRQIPAPRRSKKVQGGRCSPARPGQWCAPQAHVLLRTSSEFLSPYGG